MIRFSDAARRARLARRHALHPDHRLETPLEVARALTALHATEPSTVHLAVTARAREPSIEAVERALYDERSIVKQLAMRRTLFAFPRELLPAVWGSASARVATQQRAVIAKDVDKHGVADDGAAWVDRARAVVLDRLSDGSAHSAKELREQLPELEGSTTVAEGAPKWTVSTRFAPRLLTLLGAEASIVRGVNDGHWRTALGLELSRSLVLLRRSSSRNAPGRPLSHGAFDDPDGGSLVGRRFLGRWRRSCRSGVAISARLTD